MSVGKHLIYLVDQNGSTQSVAVDKFELQCTVMCVFLPQNDTKLPLLLRNLLTKTLPFTERKRQLHFRQYKNTEGKH